MIRQKSCVNKTDFKWIWTNEVPGRNGKWVSDEKKKWGLVTLVVDCLHHAVQA